MMPQPELSPLGRAALAYARMGYAVLPLQPRSKLPRTSHAVNDATTDEAKVIAWWTRTPDANIGVACGAPSNGLLVIDVDRRNHGDDSLIELERSFGKLPEGPEVLTGDGFHRWGRGPHEVGFGSPGAGIDIKANGYVLAPPSVHPSGHVYCWEASSRLGELALPTWPLWAVTRAGAPEGDGPDARESLLGAAFEAAGWLGKKFGHDGKRALLCPWRHEHTSGKDYDTSTCLLPPKTGSKVGWFNCKHGHCEHRTLKDVLAALPKDAVATAEGLYPAPDPKRHRRRTGEHAPPPPPVGEDGAGVADNVSRPPLPAEIDVKLNRSNTTGDTKPTLGNAVTILGAQEGWIGVLAFNEFSERPEVVAPPPFKADYAAPGAFAPHAVTDDNITRTAVWFDRAWRMNLPPKVVASAIDAVARHAPYHPVRTYLGSLAWDEVPRLDRWLTTYLGVADSPYVRLVGAWWLVSAIARVTRPGVKVDHMLVLEGGQRAGKSSALRALAGEWFLDNLGQIGPINTLQQLRGTWIIEMAEMDAVRGAALSTQKSFLTTQVDIYRDSYGYRVQHFPRQCVFAGTTNENEYLQDSTGNRRFWPVKVGKIDLDALAADRDQLWAEALIRFHETGCWWPRTAEEHALCEGEQENRYVGDPFEDGIRRHLEHRIREFPGEPVTVENILIALQITGAQVNHAVSTRVGRVMSRMAGWKQERPGGKGPRPRVYRYTKPPLFWLRSG